MAIKLAVAGDGLVDVRSLIAWLSEQDGDAIVVLASDEEGNDFHGLGSISEGTFEENKYYIELEHNDDEDEENDEGKPDHYKAVVLWP